MKRIPILLGAVLALVVSACAAEQAPSPSPSEPAATSEASADAPTESAASEPAETDDTTSTPNELAAILPTEVDGVTIEYEYATGPDIGEEGIDEEGRALVESIGGDINAMSSAFGFGTDAEAGAFLTIIAFRIPGADEQRMLEEFRSSIAGEQPDLEFTESNVGGKSVLAATSAEAGASYLYANNDTLIMIGTTTPELAEAALSQIP